MSAVYRFSRFEARPVERQLLVDGQATALGARAFDVLLALLERRDRVVAKSELLDLVWPALVVEENNLQVQVSALRKLLGPGAIATIPGRGYRFTLPLHDEQGALPQRSASVVVADPPAPPPAPRRHNLPAVSDSLIGREADIAAVLLLQALHRLVTVLGPGGIGKTRLAQEVARSAGDSYPDGVWWVDLAAQSTSENIPVAIAHAAGLQLGEGDASDAAVWARLRRRTLLVLDNCEHLAAQVASIVRAALDAVPGLHVLCTSQEPLRLGDEQLYRLDALAVPPAGTSLESARAFSALQLLEVRAQAADHRFRLSESNIGDAIDLCGQLDGIALAIEMAAARVPSLGLAGLCERLGDRLKLLRSAHRGTPPRQQTLRATMEWSCSLLTAVEQAVLRRLSVFAGSFRLPVGQYVVCSDDLDQWAALDALTALVERSLVQVELLDPPRYRLLETARLYASEQLAEHGETAATLRRHGQALASLAQELQRSYWETPDTIWVSGCASDHGDLVAAFERACAQGDADIGAATGEVLGLMNRARSVRAGVRRQKEAARALLASAAPMARARLWNCLAQYPTMALQALPHETISKERVAAWRRIGDSRQLYIALGGLALHCARAGDLDEADRALAEAAHLEEPHWPVGLLLQVAENTHFIAQFRGDPVRCRQTANAELDLANKAGSDRYRALARSQLADAALMEGDLAKSIEIGQTAVGELRALDQPVRLVLALGNLCNAHLRAGDLAAACEAIREAQSLAWEHEMGGFQFDHLAALAAGFGQFPTAARMLGYGDVTYAASRTRRQPNEAKLAAMAQDAADGALGVQQCAHLREEGQRLTEAQAEAMARQMLGEFCGGAGIDTPSRGPLHPGTC